MFTIEQIKEAHQKVKSGADFPKYIQDIRQLGAEEFETWTRDGHTTYFGANGFTIQSPPEYDNLLISETSDPGKFQHYLKLHQESKTDYYTFCTHCAETGVEKWVVSIARLTCTYFDKSGSVVLEEKIPA